MSNDTNNPTGTSTRRKFLGMAGLMGAGAVLAGCTNVGAVEPVKPNYDAKIGNFALNLEYLEAAFYLAAVGRINELKAIGGSAQIILPSGFDGTSSIAFSSPAVAQYAQEIAQDELNHVIALRAKLGSAAVDRPVLDIGPAFAAAANAAAGATLSPSFNPYLNDLFFLHGAFIFEDVGVTAYKGAARLIVDYSEGGILDSAAGILSVEAYHAGEIRTLLYAQKDVVTPYGVTVEQLIQKISDLRAAVGGGKDEGLTKNGKANIVVADSNSVAYGRSPREVLNIVYLGANASKGGFFPNGLNGDFSGLV
ncbi:ferritin-like domain-containing protein [Deinococcus gobiensis]|uniref:Dessication-associated protein n=1 Tax=Deinococcus gobiensis (strain DSM 21396 / JCM 16679 / CGMCC 1.7299 / I-0) TaxID=745776 RepID=H8GZW4_DEIGI|nr:ferritin-like domain-containing protein [Deinococcus gobiensis]AFD26276.1 Dessication-associated protein [Deinococcus gobiensis I-0]